MTWRRKIQATEAEACPAECPYPPNQNASQCEHLILFIPYLFIFCYIKLSADFLCWLFQTYSPSSQASQQESDSEGHL